MSMTRAERLLQDLCRCSKEIDSNQWKLGRLLRQLSQPGRDGRPLFAQLGYESFMAFIRGVKPCAKEKAYSYQATYQFFMLDYKKDWEESNRLDFWCMDVVRRLFLARQARGLIRRSGLNRLLLWARDFTQKELSMIHRQQREDLPAPGDARFAGFHANQTNQELMDTERALNLVREANPGVTRKGRLLHLLSLDYIRRVQGRSPLRLAI